MNKEHLNNPGLESSYEIDKELNLSIRQLQPSDANELYSLIDSNREFLRKYLYHWVDDTLSPLDCEKSIKSNLIKRANHEAYNYGIILEGRIIGFCSIKNLKERPEIGYWKAKNVEGLETEGKGIVAKTTKFLTQTAIKELNIPAVYALVVSTNEPSKNVLTKSGYIKIGEEEYPKHKNEIFELWEAK